MDTNGGFSPEELDDIFTKDVLPEYEFTVHSKGRPVTVYLGGQPGAGKTKARERIQLMYDNAIQSVDPDELRGYHPDYEHLCEQDPAHMADRTNPFAWAMVDRMVDYCKDHGIDYVIEGTWRNPEDMATWMREDHDRGRRVHAVAMAVPPALSAASTEKRYFEALERNEPARWTNVGYFEPINRDMPDFVRAVACNRLTDRFTVADRDGLVDGSDFRGSKTKLAMPIWTEHFDRPLTDPEIADCERTLNEIDNRLDHSSPEYAESRRIRVIVEQAIDASRRANAGDPSTPRTFVPVSSNAGLVWVNPYVRGDGTPVSGYWQDRS